MFVRDLPRAIDRLETERLSEPEVAFDPVRLCSVHPVKAVAERNIIADCNG